MRRKQAGLQAVILAGGKGRRLMPYTTVLPKPLMPIGEYPILEVILRQLARSGFTDVVICTGHLHELIKAYLAQRSYPGLDLRFTHEEEPLGTIGPLRLVEGLADSFLVMNGDILTDLDYRRLLAAHRRRKALATIATYHREVNVDFGVLEPDAGGRIRGFREKPTYPFEVSMGIYAFRKEILRFVPEGRAFGFDELMLAMIAEGAPVYSFPYRGYWLDIGRPDDYERSIAEFERYRDLFLG
jgi:NDP-sugar pyrophosphorylase family protein